jgi:ribulose-5-phosphate 4-epimerase/fuculose-1-phosphate aldolase
MDVITSTLSCVAIQSTRQYAPVAGLDIPPVLDELVVLTGGPIRVADYALPETQELGRNAMTTLRFRQGVLLQNHGLITVGRTLQETQEINELVERAAQVFVLSRILGSGDVTSGRGHRIGGKLFQRLQDSPSTPDTA